MDERIQQLMQKVRRIEIKTNALSSNVFAGEYHSAFKGRGMSFSEVREYQPGDDVRDIDWNVTARFDRTYVKVFEEERELNVMLLIDVSGSLDFGSQGQTQREMLTEIAATLAFSAIRNNDKIGVLFFSDRVEKFIPPAKGRSHILRIIRELLTIEPQSRKTNIGVGLEYFMRVVRKRSVAFLLSDFCDQALNTSVPQNGKSKAKAEATNTADAATNTPVDELRQKLMMARQKHDLVAVQIYDRRMAELPDVGLMKVEDAETGHQLYLDTSSKKVRMAHAKHWRDFSDRLELLLNRCRVDHAAVMTGSDYVKPLKGLLARRA
ncbi:MAG: DUF58 domain-containing protein [Bacteroidales bacterium]|nr:DUF58 domain-containing protein [Bacteroidales bacterium]